MEFAVNDDGVASDRRMRTREGLLRKLPAGGSRDGLHPSRWGSAVYADSVIECSDRRALGAPPLDRHQVHRLDGGEPVPVSRDRPDWCGDQGWFSK